MFRMKENSTGWRGEERGKWTCERGKEGRGRVLHSDRATEQEVMWQLLERALYRQVNECVCLYCCGGVGSNSFCLVPLHDPMGQTLVKLARWGQVVFFCLLL